MNKISVHLICDVKDSFMHDYLPGFCGELRKSGFDAKYFTSMSEVSPGDIAFFIACKTILSGGQLALHNANVIAHPSKLPDGRGSGAVSWKILEGDKEIWVSLFEPNNKLDRGDIHYQDCFTLDGSELCDEIRQKQAALTFQLIRRYLAAYPSVPRKVQEGKGKFYARRTPKDSEISPELSIEEQFNLLRTVDNKRYPAFFRLNGHEYVLQITKRNSS